jgi:HK97 gp10 family phage protein
MIVAGIREFQDITSFLAHLGSVNLALAAAETNALERAAKIIEADAKKQLGSYQKAAGPFNAWPRLAESTLAHHAKMGVGESPLLVTGELYASIGHQVRGNEAVVGSTSDVAVYQELGTSKIPPRPFIGPAAFKNKDRIAKILGDAVVHAMEYGAVGAFVPLPD